MRATDLPYFDAPFLALAHRGGGTSPATLARENSAFAFRTAVSLGYRYLETDVHATADGVLIAFHDDRLDRVTDAAGAVADRTWAELRDARIGGLDPIPTLAELLTAFPRARFNIDAKADAAVRPLVDHIAEFEAWDRVCVSSFTVARLHRTRALLRRRLGPRRPVASAASTAGVAWTRFVPGLPAVAHTAGQAFQVPVSQRLGGREIPIVTAEFVGAAHRVGRQVHVWTINDGEQMNQLLDLGVDGIFTDRVDTLIGVLSARGRWPGTAAA